MKRRRVAVLVGAAMVAFYIFIVVIPYYFSGYYDLYKQVHFDIAKILPADGLGIHRVKVFGSIAYIVSIGGGVLMLVVSTLLVGCASCSKSSVVDIVVRSIVLVLICLLLFKAQEMLEVIGNVLE